MGVLIDIDDKGKSVNVPYPLLELAQRGVIYADGWQQVTLTASEGSPFPTVNFTEKSDITNEST